MEIRDYLRIFRRNWMIITASMLVGLILGGVASVLVKPTYTAETQLFVSLQNSGTVAELQQGNTFSQARVQSYVKTVTTPIVLQPAIDSLGLNDTADGLAKRVRASTDLNTVLIKISVDDTSPVQAAAVAQAISRSLIAAVDSLEKPKTGGSSPVALSIVSPALAPTTPASPNVRLNLMAGLLAGLILGIFGAVLRTLLDTRIRGEDDLRRVTDAPLLGGIAYEAEASKRPLLTQVGAQSLRAESYRQLRTNLQFANVSGQAKSVVVTSSLPGEGKSTTAANLAIALAQAGQVVCLVDADLRRPMIAEYLGLEKNVGLTTVLIGDADVNEMMQPWGDDNLFVLASGQIPPNPSELLGSDQMKELVSRLEQAFDTVIIDVPPLLPVTDAAVISQYAGGVMVVVGAQKSRIQDLQKSIGALSLVGARILGVVMNRLPAKGPDAYAYSRYSYEAHPSKGTKGAGKRPKNRAPRTADEFASYGPLNPNDPDSFVDARPPRKFIEASRRPHRDANSTPQ